MAYEEEFLKCRPKAALSYLRKLHEENPGEVQDMFKLSKFYLRQGNSEKAAELMRDAFSFDAEKSAEYQLSYAC